MGTTKTQVVKYIRKGDKGDPGVNIVVSGENVVFTKQGQVARVQIQVFIGDRQLSYGDGTNDTFICSSLGGSRYILDGNVYWSFRIESDNKTFDYLLSLQQKADLSEVIPFTVTVNGIAYSKTLTFKTVYDGAKGERGATLRGPQAWADCSVGYVFQAGGEDESWKDVVLYNNNYYSCVKSHAKTASNYPGSAADVTNKYWQLGDKIELVATKILLTTYALVKNLGVEVIDMKDSSGNIIFQAKDGNVICNNGTFKNVKVGGVITANLFYSPTLSVTSASDRTYTIDPVNAPYNCYFINEPTNTRFIVLPKAADYDGLEIQVFTKVTNWNVDKMTFIQAQSSDNLYIKANAFQAATYGSSIKSVTVESQDAEYKNYKGTTAYMRPNVMCKFKSINGNWYAIEGIFTGE